MIRIVNHTDHTPTKGTRRNRTGDSKGVKNTLMPEMGDLGVSLVDRLTEVRQLSRTEKIKRGIDRAYMWLFGFDYSDEYNSFRWKSELVMMVEGWSYSIKSKFKDNERRKTTGRYQKKTVLIKLGTIRD